MTLFGPLGFSKHWLIFIQFLGFVLNIYEVIMGDDDDDDYDEHNMSLRFV